MVLDASVILAWALDDETSPYADAVQDAIAAGEVAVAPCHWQIEVANGLLMAERRERIDATSADAFLEALEKVPIRTEDPSLPTVRSKVVGAARHHRLTVYDSAYLELADRRRTALATADRLLAASARRAGVPIWAPTPRG